ncbi:MAG: beta-lactamase family protein [Bdellovibrionaceae bacterium]|nr:beta-lactamase family protein [Pseudobdellovibrionaceae bacterium]
MNLSAKLEAGLREFLDQIPVEVTPGLKVQVLYKGQMIINLSWRQTFLFYDLASLTKPLFTAMACALAVDRGRLDLEASVANWGQEFPFPQIRVRDLLSHCSGLPAYRPFFESEQVKSPDPKLYLKWLQLTFRELSVDALKDERRCVYSDLGYWALIPILEDVFQKSLYQVWLEEVWPTFYPHLSGLHFCVDNHSPFAVESYAPTARCSWRQKLIQGEVHDEHAWLMGGVRTHAGLFGPIDDVSWAMLVIRNQYLGFGRKILKEKTSKLFFQRAVPREWGDWTLGFMLPSRPESSSGQFFADESIGHTGFTGTSVWFDPKRDLIVTILSNRVFYGRHENAFAKWRGPLHDYIVDLVKKF